MDFKKRLSIKPKPQPKKFRRIDGIVFPDELIKESGRDPKDFEECEPPDQGDLLKAVERARAIKV